jgi:phosphohistidine phosphatase SixA
MVTANLSGVVSSLPSPSYASAHREYQADPELTSIGKDQAVVARNEWNAELPFGIALPQKLYCSPLTRAMQTCEITFQEINTRRVIVVEVIPSIMYSHYPIYIQFETRTVVRRMAYILATSVGRRPT